MKKYNQWDGTQAEVLYIAQFIQDSLAESFPELNKRELKSLFCASFASNLVTSEIREQMIFQFENGEDGSEQRIELNALRDKYLAHAE